MITQEQLKSALKYNPDTGDFFWRIGRRGVRLNHLAGSASKSGYRMIRIDGVRYSAHRLIFLYIYGEFPPDQVDHINGDRTDNRRVNLRRCSCLENHKNKRMPTNNKSGFNGVHWRKKSKKWLARIQVNHKRIELGKFKNKQDAIAARKAANVKYGFHKNHGNSVKDKQC